GALPLTITGSGGADHLVGSAGADTITGGPGVDTMTGGAGPDHFVFNSGGAPTPNSDSSMPAMDIITDFHHGGGANVADFIDLNGFNFIAAGTANVTAAT